MADNNVQGHWDELLRILASDTWRDVWNALAFTVASFEVLGLDRNAPDRVVWLACQQHQLVLFTANRNADGPDSLEGTLRTLGRIDSLPVIT